MTTPKTGLYISEETLKRVEDKRKLKIKLYDSARPRIQRKKNNKEIYL